MKSRTLDRRTFLRGAGVALALPYLDCMADASTQDAPPKRFCAFYFPYGVSLPPKDSKEANWRWFPEGDDRDFQFNDSLQPLEPLRKHLTVLGGLSHPNCRKMGGHDTGDTFLTGTALTDPFLKNSVSIDQVASAAIGGKTRFPSLVLSTDGGVGEPTRSSTLSYSRNGHPIPALNQPQAVFDRLFKAGDPSLRRQQRSLRSAASMLDLVAEHARTIRRGLGVQDRAKLDEYLESVRQTEQRVKRSQAWLEVPRPELTDDERERLHLDADDDAPKQLMQTMYDLIYLAFRTDSTRVATYQIASMGDGSSKAGKFPRLLGFAGSLHNLAHGWEKPGGSEKLGKWDRFMASQFGNFLERLRSTPEAGGTMLDHTIALYGSSNSETHNNTNYPLLLAGGNGLGLKHGRYVKFGEETPLSNLFVTVLDRLDVPVRNFADSTGEMSEIV